MRKLLPAMMMLLMPLAAMAETGVIADHIPRGADQAVVIAIVRHAVTSRGWELVSVATDSVSARNNTPKLRTELTIRINGSQLVYDGSAKRVGKGLLAPIPPRWLNTLRLDIGSSLATIPDK